MSQPRRVMRLFGLSVTGTVSLSLLSNEYANSLWKIETSRLAHKVVVGETLKSKQLWN